MSLLHGVCVFRALIWQTKDQYTLVVIMSHGEQRERSCHLSFDPILGRRATARQKSKTSDQ